MVMYGMKRFNNVARTILYMPVVIPAVGVAAMFSKIYEIEPNYGLINSVLALLNLNEYAKAWAGLSTTALGAICVADIWRAIGYYMVIFYAGLANIPKELEEAAKIDGANFWQRIRHIIMPILSPVTLWRSYCA